MFDNFKETFETHLSKLGHIIFEEIFAIIAFFIVLFIILLLSSLISLFEYFIDKIQRNHQPGEKLKRLNKKMLSDSELDKATTSGGETTTNELKKVPSDLIRYRKRIDSSVQEQRKQREIIQNLQSKVQKYRQKAAEAEVEAINSARGLGHGQSFPSLLQGGNIGGNDPLWNSNIAFPSTSRDYGFSQSTPGLSQIQANYRVAGSNPILSAAKSPSNRRSIKFAESLNDFNPESDPTVDLYRQRLKEEQYRNNVLEEMVETLKRQAESTSHTNESLTNDLLTLHDTVTRAEQSRIRSAEVSKQREQKLKREKQLLQRQFYDVSMEIGTLRRKINELKSETETDLQNYKADFDRCSKTMENRMKHHETLRTTTFQRAAKEHDHAFEEVMKRYDDAVNKSLQTEHERNEVSRKVIFLESALKRAQEEKEQIEDSLKKIHQLPEVAEALGRRTRSVSPVSIGSLGHETIRNIRLALHSRNDEIETYKKEANNFREKYSESEDKLQKVETEKKKLERKLKDEKAARDEVQDEKDSLEKQLARLQDKYEKSEAEKQNMNNTMLKLNEQIAELKANHQAAIDEIKIKQQNEWDERLKQISADHEQIEESYNQRLQRARHEAETLRADISKQRDAAHELQNELIAEKRKVVEKKNELTEASKKYESLEKEITNLTQQLQEKEVTIVQLEKITTDFEHKEKQNAEKMDELQIEKETLVQENSQLMKDVNELRGDIEELNTQLETAEEGQKDAQASIEEYKQQINELEKLNVHTRMAVTDLEVKIENTSDLNRTLERELAEERKEVTKNLEIIGEMHKEKADLINVKESLQLELEQLEKDLAEERSKRTDAEKRYSEIEQKLNNSEDKIDQLEEAKQTLTLRVKELNSEMTSLKESLSKSETLIKEHKESTTVEIQRHRDESEKQIESLKNEHSEIINQLETEKSAMQKEISTLEERIEKLSENHTKAVGDYKLLTEQFDVHKTDKDEEIGRLKEKIIKMEEDALQDLTDLSEQRSKEKADFEEQIRKLEKDIIHAEEYIREGLMRENELKGQIEMLESRLSQGAEMVLNLKKQLEELGEHSEELNAQAESEREQLRSQIDQLNASLAWTKQEKEEAHRKISDLEQTLQLTESKANRQQGRIKELDEEVGEAAEKIRNYENQISEFKFKIKDLESQLSEISDQRDKYKTLLKQIEGENRDLHNEQTNLKKQLAVAEARISEADHRHEQRLSELRKINSERKDLELSFTDKTTELSSLNTVIKQYEHHQIGYIKEIAEEKEKSTKLEQQMAKLKTENKHTKEELEHAKGQLEKKTATNQAVINDLLDNYRQSEKDKLTALREVEERGAEIEVLRHRLELGDRKKKDLEDRIAEVVKERDSLIERLNYYERSAKKALTFAQTHVTTRAHSQEPLTRYQDLDLEEDLFDPPSSSTGSPRNMLKPSLSTHDIPSHSTRFIQKVQSSSNFDIQNSMEVTFKLLKDKIASLEEERRTLMTRLRKAKAESEEFHANFLDQKQKVADSQKIIQRLHEDKIALETRLISSRQILVAQEESLRARDQDKKSFKAKIASADMHSRDKDARLQSLQNEITTLKLEIQNLEDDKKKFKDVEISWERERRNLENALKEAKSELENVRRERIMLIRDKERPKEVRLIQSVNRITLTHRLKETEQQTSICQQKCSELERTIERRQQSLSKMQHDETQWKHKIDSMKRTAADYQQMEIKIESLKIELEAMTQKWKNSENDREQIRRELIECRSRLNSTSLKTNDLQMIITELSGEKKRYQDRIEILEKYERDNTSTERELRRELEQIKSEKLTMIAETEELKRQLHRVDVTKKELEAQIARLERERSALKRHVETIEMDKQRIEGVVRQTSLERHALDKSLSAMEKENTELYRNCSLLQSQLNQLDRENAARTAEANNNKRMKLEAEIHKLNQEKRQLEKLIEQREQNYLQKYKMYESQLNILREQLDAERRRRRELTNYGGTTFQTTTASRRPPGPSGGGGSGKPPFRI